MKTKEEILHLIDKDITSQGSNICTTGSLGAILKGLTEVAFETAPSARMYQLCENGAGGNVVHTGELDMEGQKYGIYQLFYRTGPLPDTRSKEYFLADVLNDYNIRWFIGAEGVTSDGIAISSGRTDGTNAIIVQQFSRNDKTVTIRSYQDFTRQVAMLRITFIGSKA